MKSSTVSLETAKPAYQLDTPKYVNDLEQLMLDFEDAQADLVGAEAAYSDAQLDLLSVKAQLDTSKAELIIEGVEGKTLQDREASLRLALHEQFQELHLCECELNRTKLHLFIAQKAWDVLRYKLRALEAIGGLSGG